MYPGKGSVQEVMGLPPRSVTKSRNPNRVRDMSCGLSEMSKPEVTSRIPQPNVTCRCVLFGLYGNFYTLSISALKGKERCYSKATNSCFLSLIHSCKYASLASAGIGARPPTALHASVHRLQAQWMEPVLMQGKQALNLCLHQVIHKGTTKLLCAQTDSLMNMLAQGLFAYCSMLQVRGLL